ncbi:MAG: FKBP-type peptidyl-prolyl cis-trans isomerase [Halobacteriota archaeon]
MAIESGDTVSLEYIGRIPDGDIFDTSRETVATEAGIAADQPDREFVPLTVEVGAGQIIPGLEDALLDMDVGDTDTVTIPPEEAYGEETDEQIIEHERDEFEDMLQGETPEEGMQVQTQQGQLGTLVHVDDETVRVDFNHELAGETLEFEVEIVDVQ